MQFKVPMKYHLIPVRMVIIKQQQQMIIKSVGEDVGKLEHYHTVSRTVKWCSDCREQFKKLKN